MAAPLRTPPSDPSLIASLETTLTLPAFTAPTAWTLGVALRTRLLSTFAPSRPAVISITSANSSQLLFHAVTHAGTAPDNDAWVARKRRTVLRWGHSTWWMHVKMGGDEAAFAAKYGLGAQAGEYAIHGGGWPVRVRGVDGVVGVIVVSGLRQEEDHQVIVEVLEEYLEGVEGGGEGESVG